MLRSWIKEDCLGPLINENPRAVPYLMENPEKIDWNHLSKNPAAMDLLMANLDKIRIGWLAKNPAAVPYVLKNTPLVNSLACGAITNDLNMNPAAMDFFKEHPERINWGLMSINPAAKELLEANQDKLELKKVSN